MRSYSLRRFKPREMKLLELAEQVVLLLPDHTKSSDSGVASAIFDDIYNLVRCHEVARIVRDVAHEVFRRDDLLWVEDGRYGFCDHSWLWTSEPIRDAHKIHCPNILDPYCPGSLPQVRLLDCSATSLPHYGAMYLVGQERTDIDRSFVTCQTARLVCALTKNDARRWILPT